MVRIGVFTVKFQEIPFVFPFFIGFDKMSVPNLHHMRNQYRSVDYSFGSDCSFDSAGGGGLSSSRSMVDGFDGLNRVSHISSNWPLLHVSLDIISSSATYSASIRHCVR